MTMGAEIKRAQGPDNGHVTGSGNTVRITPLSQPLSSKKEKGAVVNLRGVVQTL